MTKPAALFFDVFGTLVDFRSTVARDAATILEGAGALPRDFDGGAFADAWRAEYQPAMQEIREGGRGFVKLDVLHRENLDRILPRFGLKTIPDAVRADLNLIWHKLDAWRDVTPSLRRLSVRHLLAPMSNGNISLMVDMARHNHWHWDAILGAEIARDYKPRLEVYRAGCSAFDLPPERCMMVAAHTDDLVAAKAAGLLTAHVARPDEHGPGKGEAAPSAPVDLVARNLDHLAELLGC